MENTALNGTTVTKDQEWKTKKGYGPIIVAVSLALLLGLSFYAGRHSTEMMGMTNGVASSSSSSLTPVCERKYPVTGRYTCKTNIDCMFNFFCIKCKSGKCELSDRLIIKQ